MNQPHPDDVLADFAKQLDMQVAVMEYEFMLMQKEMGVPIWFH
jgi:hypothetical protein